MKIARFPNADSGKLVVLIETAGRRDGEKLGKNLMHK